MTVHSPHWCLRQANWVCKPLNTIKQKYPLCWLVVPYRKQQGIEADYNIQEMYGFSIGRHHVASFLRSSALHNLDGSWCTSVDPYHDPGYRRFGARVVGTVGIRIWQHPPRWNKHQSVDMWSHIKTTAWDETHLNDELPVLSIPREIFVCASKF